MHTSTPIYISMCQEVITEQFDLANQRCNTKDHPLASVSYLDQGSVVIIVPIKVEVSYSNAGGVGAGQQNGGAVHRFKCGHFPCRDLQSPNAPHTCREKALFLRNIKKHKTVHRKHYRQRVSYIGWRRCPSSKECSYKSVMCNATTKLCDFPSRGSAHETRALFPLQCCLITRRS